MPASVIGVDFDYTYDGKLSTEVLFKPSINTPPMNDLFTPYTGLKYKQQIPLLLPLEKIVKEYTSCTRVFSEGVDITNTTLTLTPLDVNLPWCVDDFEGTVGNILAEEWLKSGVEQFDPSGTQIQRIINQLVEDAVRRDNFRIISFGDTNDGNADYNQLDGLWTKLIGNASGGNAYCVNRAASFATDELEAGEALAALKEVYNNSATILKQLPNNMKYFAVTGTIYENLLGSYEANVNGTERQFTLLTDGAQNLTYRGIRIVPIYAWDASLEDPDNPLFGTVRHLILYTTRANHAIGMDVPGDAERISGWYERKDRKYYIEGFQRLGYNYIHCQLQTVGY